MIRSTGCGFHLHKPGSGFGKKSTFEKNKIIPPAKNLVQVLHLIIDLLYHEFLPVDAFFLFLSSPNYRIFISIVISLLHTYL